MGCRRPFQPSDRRAGAGPGADRPVGAVGLCALGFGLDGLQLWAGGRFRWSEPSHNTIVRTGRAAAGVGGLSKLRLQKVPAGRRCVFRGAMRPCFCVSADWRRHHCAASSFRVAVFVVERRAQRADCDGECSTLSSGGLRAWAYFLLRYVIWLGFLDSRQGRRFHRLQGLWYRRRVDRTLALVARYMRDNRVDPPTAIRSALGLDVTK